MEGIFYVGKGSCRRARSVKHRNKYHASIVSKHGEDNILIGTLECSNEQTAFELEKGLIKCLTRSGVKLANMTIGGEGASGNKGSEKQRQHMILLNQFLTPDDRKYNRSKEPLDTNERRAKTMKKVHAERSESEKTRLAAITSANNLKTWSDPEVRSKRVAGMLGKKKTMSPAALESRKLNAQKRRKLNLKGST